MNDKTYTLLHNLLKDCKRLLPMLAIALLILVPDTGSFVVLYSIGITLGISAVSHVIRKVLFPYLDMAKLAAKAAETSGGSAAIFASISFILAVIIFSTVSLLK